METRAQSAPRAVRAAVLATSAHAALHLAVPPLMSAQRGAFVEELRTLYPELLPDAAAGAVRQLLLASLVYHLVFAALLAAFAAFTLRARRSARAALTVVLVLGLLGTALSFSSPTPAPILYKSLNAVSWLLGLGAIAFLWAPAPARTFFAKRPRPIDRAA